MSITKSSTPDLRSIFDKVQGWASGAILLQVIGVADATGLLKYLHALKQPQTVAQITAGTKLVERYVQETLHALAAGAIIQYDEKTGCFSMWPGAGAVLADETHPLFMAGWPDFAARLTSVRDGVVKAMKEGGGVAFSEYKMGNTLNRINAPSSNALLVKKWLPGVPGMVKRMESGITVADVGCGSGHATITMAKAFPKSKFTGFDVDDASLVLARSQAVKAGVKNAEFVLAGAEDLPANSFDFVLTFDVIHDIPHPLPALQSLQKSLKPGGIYVMVEPKCSAHLGDNVKNGLGMMYGISLLHCMTQSLARGGIGLGSCWGPDQAKQYGLEAGFKHFVTLPINNAANTFFGLSNDQPPKL
ncbi:hypothetical protein SmJEL517_g01628 [Synchytrium microbalum]|uniref:Uncharacterized protein n=1 Tax=Synchytrium microbalum TaxID=1806994 RepID=A0A507C439_9FUNG|nr:uncharacterized protein SmJEL517_g01628 [Synchytrium microbalum]TPX36300.1 hypothetical protein SmJEL517_g01628 [Synchytrium microbalum]